MTMTNEEAIEQIKILKAFTGYDEDNPIVQRIQESLDMAIKALERQEKTLSYIDRLLNQGTGKKKSLEFLKKYILEGKE